MRGQEVGNCDGSRGGGLGKDGLRERGTKGKWVLRKGNRWGEGLRERETEARWVKRKGNRGKKG
jgi:hypothetical protein